MGGVTSTNVDSARETYPEAWACYLAAAGIVHSSDDEELLHFLVDAISSTPLPAPWTAARDEHDQRVYLNRYTGEYTWRHPLDATQKELAELFRKCSGLSSALRNATLIGMREKWESEARGEYLRWHFVEATGQRYYYNRETGESMWEHPAEVLLPAHYMKIKAIKRLSNDTYLTGLALRTDAASCVSEMPQTERECLEPPATECRLFLEAMESPPLVTCV